MPRSIDEINALWVQKFPNGSDLQQLVVTLEAWLDSFHGRYFLDIAKAREVGLTSDIKVLHDEAIDSAANAIEIELRKGRDEAALEAAKALSWKDFHQIYATAQTSWPMAAGIAIQLGRRLLDAWHLGVQTEAYNLEVVVAQAHQNASDAIGSETDSAAQAALVRLDVFEQLRAATAAVVEKYEPEVAAMQEALNDANLDYLAFLQHHELSYLLGRGSPVAGLGL